MPAHHVWMYASDGQQEQLGTSNQNPGIHIAKQTLSPRELRMSSRIYGRDSDLKPSILCDGKKWRHDRVLISAYTTSS